jgi:hypothetical protein
VSVTFPVYLAGENVLDYDKIVKEVLSLDYGDDF